MTLPYQLLIFDWDGTLADTTHHIVETMQSTAKALNFPIPEVAAIRRGIGLGPLESLRLLYPDLPTTDLHIIYQAFQDKYFSSDRFARTVLFTGALATLTKLKVEGYFLAIATGKSRRGLNEAMDTLSLKQLFAATRTADETSSKPNPMMLHEILDELNIEAEQALMIGDSEFDMQLARNAKVPALAVSYGVGEREELMQLNPVDCLDDITELTPWLKSRRMQG